MYRRPRHGSNVSTIDSIDRLSPQCSQFTLVSPCYSKQKCSALTHAIGAHRLSEPNAFLRSLFSFQKRSTKSGNKMKANATEVPKVRLRHTKISYTKFVSSCAHCVRCMLYTKVCRSAQSEESARIRTHTTTCCELLRCVS